MSAILTKSKKALALILSVLVVVSMTPIYSIPSFAADDASGYLNNAKNYTYSGYDYAGEFQIASNSVDYTVDSEAANGNEPNMLSDMIRFIGAIYRGNVVGETSQVTAIIYDGAEYVWSEEKAGNLKGSNWCLVDSGNGEAITTSTTLAKTLMDDVKAGNITDSFTLGVCDGTSTYDVSFTATVLEAADPSVWLSNAKAYQYEGYAYSGEFTVGEGTVEYAVDPDKAGANNTNYYNDMIRYIGAIYRANVVDGTPQAIAITYDGAEYIWDEANAGNLKGSNWYSAAAGKTLAKAIMDGIKAGTVSDDTVSFTVSGYKASLDVTLSAVTNSDADTTGATVVSSSDSSAVGKTVEIVITEVDSDEALEAAFAKSDKKSEFDIAATIDASVYCDGNKLENTVLSKAVEIKIPYADAENGKKYTVARMHAGAIDFLNGVGGEGYVSVKSNKFSAYAVLEAAETFTVTYSAGEGTGTAPVDETAYSKNEEVSVKGPVGISKEGYSFAGWKRSDNMTVVMSGDTFNMPEMNITLTAQWSTEPVKYSVSYMLNGGTGTAPEDANSYIGDGNETITLPAAGDIVKDGYRFAGWKCSANDKVYAAGDTYTVPASNVVFTAQWNKEYFVSYVVNGATTSDENKYLKDETVTVGINVDTAKEGYIFTGWKNSSDGNLYADGSTFPMPAENISLVAEYVPEESLFTVTYDVDGVTDAEGYVDSKKYKYDDTVKIVAGTPAKDDYTFAGWKRSDNGQILNAGDNINMPAKNLTLTAQWNSVEKYAITYDVNGGTGDAPAMDAVVSGSNVTVMEIGEVTKEGYRFANWNTKADGTGEAYQAGNTIVMPEENFVLYAQWSKEYTVKFDLGDGAGQNGNPDSIESQTVVIGDYVKSVGLINGYTTTSTDGTDTNYYFTGWQNQNGDMWSFEYDTVTEGCFVNGEMTLTAQWDTIQHYNIVFDDNLDDPIDDYVTINGIVDEDGCVQTDNVASNAIMNKSDIPEIARVDYTFNGWYLDQNGTYYFDTTSPIDNNSIDHFVNKEDMSITVYAGWTPNFTESSDVVIYPDTVTSTGTYNQYYSDFIEARHQQNILLSYRVFRNFYILNGELPTGLYLNQRTGEIYGIPSEVGEFTCTVVMGNDMYMNGGHLTFDQISETADITITINPIDVDIDHKAGNKYTYDKTYGDKEENAMDLTDATKGRTYWNFRNLDINYSPEVDATLANNDKSLIIDYDYTENNAERVANAATFSPEKGKENTLQYAPDLNDPAVDDTRQDNLTVQFKRIEGEDADTYKIYMPYEDVIFNTKSGVSIGTVGKNIKEYAVVIAEEFETTEKTDSTAAQYLFTINPAKLTIDMKDDSKLKKLYGNDNKVLPSDKLAVSDVLNAAVTTTPVLSGKSQDITITFDEPSVGTETLTLGYVRTKGEDADDYKLYLNEDAIIFVDPAKADNYDIEIAKDFATDELSDDTKDCYKFTIKQRLTEFKPAEASVEYGTVKPGAAVEGTFNAIEGKQLSGELANNENISVVDEALVNLSTEIAASTSGYVNAGTYGISAFDIGVTNTAYEPDKTTKSDDTTANYKMSTTYTVTKKALTVEGQTVEVALGEAVTEDNINDLVEMTGAIVGDDVDFTVSKYTIDGTNYTSAAEAAAAISTEENGEVTVKVTMSGLTGADKGNYTLSPKSVEATISVVGTVVPKTTLTASGKTVKVLKDAAVTEANIKALAVLNGVASGDSVEYTVEKYTIAGTDYATAAEAAAAISTAAEGNTAVTVTISGITGADKDKYEFEPCAVEGTITVYTSSGGGGGGGGGAISSSYKIVVEEAENGAATANAKTSAAGKEVVITAEPDSGYRLASVTVTYSKDKTVAVTINGNEATFIMPADDVTVTPLFKLAENQFNDVDEDAYYYEPVIWAVDNGITTGITDTSFGPEIPCTRAQMVTFLWRAAGEPSSEINVDEIFTDIEADAYYVEAVGWAIEKGITNGVSATEFAPHSVVTRAQTVTFLHRYNGLTKVTVDNPFTDVAEGSYYYDAVLWAVDSGITKGMTETTFEPDSNCTRAQIVTFLQRASLLEE